jgi:hypothetical protein
MERLFKPLLKADQQTTDDITFLAESASVLERSADRLELPDAGLVHLYWTLFWYDHCQNRPDEAYLLRRLIHHLFRADVGQCSYDLARRMNEKLFEVALYAIDASLRASLFRELPELVCEHALIYYETKDVQQREQSQYRLLRRCWNVYSVLGDEKVLANILRAQELTGEGHEAGVAQSVPGLEQLFLEATEMSTTSRDELGAAFRRWAAAGKGSEDGQSAVRHASACASWLFSNIRNLVPWTAMPEMLFGQADRDFQKWPDIFDQTCQRIVRDKSNLPTVTDMMTLSLCLWSAALVAEKGASEWGALVTEKAADALIVAQELKERMVGPNMDVLLHGLWRELSAVALATVLTAQRTIRTDAHHSAQSQTIKIIADGIALLRPNDHSSLEDLDLEAPKLAADIDTILSQCAVVWMVLGLDRLRDFANLRRLQFAFLCRGIKPEDQTQGRPLMEFASTALASKGYTGLLANCAVARSCSETKELLTHYLFLTAQSTLERDFGWQLQRELALLIILHGHTRNIDLERHLKALLKIDADGTSFLRRFLELQSASDLPSTALALFNIAARSRDEALFTGVQQTAAEITEFLPEGDEKNELLALIEFQKLSHGSEQGASLPQEQELLDPWNARKHLWLYSALLRLCIRKGRPGQRTWSEAYAALERDPWKDEFTSYLLLAIELGADDAEYKPNEQQRSTLVAYLKDGIRALGGSHSAEINISAYRSLSRLDPTNRIEFRSSLIYWEKIKTVRDHLKRLRELAEQKRYLIIFWEYYTSTYYWGLETDASGQQWRDYKIGDFEQRTATLHTWVSEGTIVPEPFVPNRGPVISSRFLWIGYYLFSPPNDIKPEYENARLRFAEAARRNLPHLVDIILKLPEMPAELHDLFAYYSKQLLREVGLIDIKETVVRATAQSVGA